VDGSADSREYTPAIAPSRKRYGEERMNTMKVGVLTLLSVAIVLSAGCTQPRDISASTTPAGSFAVVIKNSGGKTFASGNLSLPTDITKGARFSGSCEIQVSQPPEQPSSEEDYAIRCLSQNNGLLSGTVKDGVVRIELHPQIDDNTIHLEGTINGQLFNGKCFYQSYAGSKEFGTFETKIENKEIP
jgi:hypothetical protein